MPSVSSEPHFWLRPIFRRLASNRTFALVSTETQFAMLVDTVAEHSEHHAAVMRQYTPAARAALLGHLSKAEQQRPGQREVELWVMHKDERVLTCVARYLPHGVDVRLIEAEEVCRTQLTPDGPHAEGVAADWQSASEHLGWYRR